MRCRSLSGVRGSSRIVVIGVCQQLAAAFRGCGLFCRWREVNSKRVQLLAWRLLASGEALEQAFDSRHAFPQIADIPANFTQAAVENAPKRDTGAHDGHDDCDCVQVHGERVARGDLRRRRAKPCETSRFAARCRATDVPRRRFPALGRSCSRSQADSSRRRRFLPVRKVARRVCPRRVSPESRASCWRPFPF